ncbi:MAG: tetratricopeptide repeat protein [Spirochaetes bacterium]|nr:tetratricopeptide repeat protein [Spirochaetota bacterium]
MRRSLIRVAAAAAVMAMTACYSYRAVPVERKYAAAEAGAPVIRLSAQKYFTRMRSLSPVAAINNRAVELSAQGRFGEAEILFREVVAEDPREPAGYNNLGILCELSGRRDEAFRMYAAACRLRPGNAAFKRNFSSFADRAGE